MSLKKQTFLGLIWSFLDTLFIRGLMFVSMIVLARWIGPTQFGLIGMISVFLAVGKSLTDSGMTSSLIRAKEANQSDYSTVFIVNLIISIVVYSLAYFAAPLISDFYGYKILTDVIRVYCLVFFFSSLFSSSISNFNKIYEF
jgi:O-antigen/teichoic acid export membrane protein